MLDWNIIIFFDAVECSVWVKLSAVQASVPCHATSASTGTTCKKALGTSSSSSRSSTDYSSTPILYQHEQMPCSTPFTTCSGLKKSTCSLTVPLTYLWYIAAEPAGRYPQQSRSGEPWQGQRSCVLHLTTHGHLC